MIDMPSRVDIENRFGSVTGMAASVKSRQREALDQEARGRHTREAQVQDNCSVQASVLCPLGGTGTGTPVGTWVDFGRIAFTSRPNVAVGAATGWGSKSVEAVFGLARVDEWKVVAGLYRSAYVVCGYIGSPSATAGSMDIDVTFIGPALRLG
jgi:hypothetical protein